MQYDELICDTVAQAILGNDYDAACDYYLYMDMGEMSIRAVSRDTGCEVWTESRRIDVGDAIVSKRDKITPKYYGHWFSGKMVSHESWASPIIFIFLWLIVVVLFFILMKGGQGVWVI